jgi:hypothetical protein
MHGKLVRTEAANDPRVHDGPHKGQKIFDCFERRGKEGYHIPESYDLPIQLKLKQPVRSVFDIFFWEIVSLQFCD